MSKQIFTKFPELPAKLQVAIIGYALDENIKRRDNKLTIYYNIQGGFRNRELKHRGVRLPQLPAIYHVNRLFRAEAVRAHPIYQLFDGTPRLILSLSLRQEINAGPWSCSKRHATRLRLYSRFLGMP
jgi:hypothetical protein